MLHLFRRTRMKRKSFLSIPLLLAFLLLTQIARAQNSLKITPKIGRSITLSAGLADTIIHDLKERKLLTRKDSIQKAYISILERESASRQTNVYELQKSLLISEKKRSRNGWQRNSLLIITGFLTYLIITK
jgi:hypothetical protein